MLSDPWRLQPAVPDLIGDGGSTDEEDDYDDTGFDDPYEVARKVREANARLRADSTPVESSRERRVRFRDPIRAVLCFTPDGEEEEEEESSKDEDRPPAGDEDDDQEGDASIADDPTARYGTVRRLVTAAAVERRSSLTSEEPLLPTPAVAGGLGSKNSSEKLLGLGADSDEDIDSFESDNTSVSEDISELTGDKDDNQDASVQEVSDASEDEDADGDRLKSTGADSRVAAESSSSTEDDREAKPRLSWDSSVEEAASIGVQEEVPSDVSAERVQARNEEDVAVVGGSPVRAPQHKEDPSSAPTSDSSPPEDDETCGELSRTATVGPQSCTTGTRSSTGQGTLASVYGGTPRPRSVGAGSRVGGTPPRAATAGRGRSGFVASEAAQRARRPWTGVAQTSAASSTSRVSSAGSAARTSEQGPPVHTKQQQKRQPMSARQASSSSADGSKMDTKTPYAVPVGSSATSTYALPRELKEELVRKKRRERELREQREAREERERRQRAQEADQAFKAWLAKKRRQGSLPRSDRSEESSSRSESSRATDDGERRGAASSSAAFEAWLRRKQRQQREEELRRRLRQLDLEATERPRRSRHEAQQVYLAWLERKCEEERQRRQAAWAERRGGREAALSARSLRILERYLRSDEFARYPELVV